MKTKKLRRISASILILALLLICCAGCDPKKDPQTSTGGQTSSNTSEPDTSETKTSEPDTSEPDTSEPDTSEPDTSEPDTSEPDTSEAWTESGSFTSEIKDANGAPVRFTLGVKWTAARAENSKDVTVKADVYLEHYTLTVGERKNGKLVIGGEEKTFTTQAISTEDMSAQTSQLYSVTFTLSDWENGKDIDVKLDWYFGGVYSGVEIGWINAEGVIEADNT